METALAICPNCHAKAIQGHNVCYKCNVYYKEKTKPLSGDQKNNPCPNNWMTEAILMTLFWNTLLGIGAICYASEVKALYNAGDYEGAVEASKKARNWIRISFVIGFVFILIYIIFVASL